VESRLLGFPPFPYSVISMACFGNACRKITITAKTRFGNGNHLSALPPIRQVLCVPCSMSIDDLSLIETGAEQQISR
jgi:hypothetical protein